MTTITKSTDVHAPIAKVYDQWTQFESFPHFMGGVESIEQRSDRTLHWTVSIAGVNREFDAKIVEQHPEERVAWKSTDGPEHAGVVTFHNLSDSETRVTVQLDWQPDSAIEKVGSAINVDDHQVSSDLKRFKEFIENEGATSEGWRGDIPREG